MKNKLLKILLILPFLLTTPSCSKSQEIDANKAKEIYTSIEKYLNDEFEHDSYTRVLTSKSDITNKDSKTEVKINDKIKKNGNTIYDNFERFMDGKKDNSKLYFYEKDGKYYRDDKELEKTFFESLTKTYSSKVIASNYLKTVELYISACLRGTEIGEFTFYSNGEGNLTVVEVLEVKNKDYTYHSQTTYSYDNYKFSYYEFKSEKNNASSDKEIQFRTDSVKYNKPLIIVPYK